MGGQRPPTKQPRAPLSAPLPSKQSTPRLHQIRSRSLLGCGDTVTKSGWAGAATERGGGNTTDGQRDPNRPGPARPDPTHHHRHRRTQAGAACTYHTSHTADRRAGQPAALSQSQLSPLIYAGARHASRPADRSTTPRRATPCHARPSRQPASASSHGPHIHHKGEVRERHTNTHGYTLTQRERETGEEVRCVLPARVAPPTGVAVTLRTADQNGSQSQSLRAPRRRLAPCNTAERVAAGAEPTALQHGGGRAARAASRPRLPAGRRHPAADRPTDRPARRTASNRRAGKSDHAGKLLDEWWVHKNQ